MKNGQKKDNQIKENLQKKRDTFKKDNKKEKRRKNIYSRKRTKNENVQKTDKKKQKKKKTFFFCQRHRESTNIPKKCENVQKGKRYLKHAEVSGRVFETKAKKRRQDSNNKKTRKIR